MAQQQTCEVEVFVVVDENGDYAVAKDADELGTAYDNDIGGDTGLARRVLKLTVSVPLPQTVESAARRPRKGKPALTVQ